MQEAEKQKHPIFEKIIKFIGDIFGPVVNVLCAVGLLKGILTIFITAHWLTTSNGTYQILWLLSNTFFYFLPVFLAFTTSKVLKTNEFTAVLIAGFLIHPQFVQLLTKHVKLFNIQVPNTSYESTVLPIILAVFLLYWVEKLLKKILPKLIQDMFVPLISLIIVLPITLFILGPIGNLLAQGVTSGYNLAMNISPIIGMTLLAGLFPLFIMVEISTALVPVVINNIATNGNDTILISLGMSLFALAGMSLAIYLNTHDDQMKSAAFSGVVTALLGIGEPSVFGVGIANRKQFLGCMLSSAVGGVIVGIFKTKVTAFLIPSVVTFPAYIGQPGYLGMMIGAPVAFVLSFIVNSMISKQTN